MPLAAAWMGKDQSGLTGNAKVYDKHPVYIRKAFQMARSKTLQNWNCVTTISNSGIIL